VDGLRGLAIALVLVHHLIAPLFSSTPGSAAGYVATALTLTYTGVDLFFVLSGFLIGGILLDHRSSPRLLSAFYWRRAARILPLAFMCVAAGIASAHLGWAEGEPWPWSVYVFFGVNFWMAAAGAWGFLLLAPLWSLAIEEQFYLAAPWIVRRLPAARLPWLFAALILAAPLARWLILTFWPHAHFAASLLPFCRTDSLGLGLLGAWIMRHPPAQAWCRQHRALLWAIFVSAVVGAAYLTRIRADNAGAAMAGGGYTVMAVFYFLLLLATELGRESAFTRACCWWPLRQLGRYAYFIYLFHGMVVGLAVSLFFHQRVGLTEPSNWIQVGVGLCGLLVVAVASWHWFELPLLNWTRRRAAYG
jgi:peptidoglycan/LPS O-acetylase OafA/YrhL